MPAVADRVRETTITAGTVDITLGGAVDGFQAFSVAFPSGTVVYYCITDGINWEVGFGTAMTGTPWTIARDTILASSTGGAKIDFPAGTKDVFCTAPAASYLTSAQNSLIPSGIPSVGQVPTATSATTSTWQTPSGGGSGVISNVISAPTTIATDTSYIVASYLNINSDLTINGNLLITG